MTGLRISPAALHDLDAIWSYTSRIWGLDQADNYIATLHRDMSRLIDFPQLGPAHRSRVGDFRKLASGHHLIFYLVLEQHVEVVRILHERMDVERQLGG
jgi:toxin ParE1/3/4